jgi:hypothetical protein
MIISNKKSGNLLKNTNFRIFLILLFAFCIYFPLTFLGFGSDNDSAGVANTAKVLIEKHFYQPSRFPGFFIHEFISAFLILLGGSILSNSGTLIMSLITIFFFIKVCSYYNIKNIFLLSLIIIFHPIYLVNSTCTIDYIWAIGFFFSGYYFFLKEKYFLSSMFFALSVGSRITSILPVLSVYSVYYINSRNIKILISFAAAIILSSIFYIPQFIYYVARDLSFLKNYIGNWTLAEYLIRFIYKNIYFWGFPAFLYILILIALNLKKIISSFKEKKEIIILALLIIFLIEILFLRIPLENEYLLPMLPFFLIIFGLTFPNKRFFLYILLILIFSYNLINFNFIKVDRENNAKKGEIGFFIEKGYLLNDIEKRLKLIKIQDR